MIGRFPYRILMKKIFSFVIFEFTDIISSGFFVYAAIPYCSWFRFSRRVYFGISYLEGASSFLLWVF